MELPGDKVEWRVAAASSAGGLIPQFITDAVMPGTLARVCLSFLIRRLTADNVITWLGRAVILEVDKCE
jgi:hypothetical protein